MLKTLTMNVMHSLLEEPLRLISASKLKYHFDGLWNKLSLKTIWRAI